MAQDNNKLNNAKSGKNDEFYTLIEEIEKELVHYKDFFKDKIVYCNCDNEESQFLAFLRAVKDDWGIKDVWNSYIREDGSNGFEQNVELLDKCDVVVTNPPFSKFRDFIKLLMEHNKKFLIIGNMNGIKYKEIFPYIKENKLWVGYSFNVSMLFKTPYGNYSETNRKQVINKGYDPNNYIIVPCCCWYTNIPNDKQNEEIPLTLAYNSEIHPKYDNFDAIEVGNVKKIPYDYNGLMGVPITFLGKYNPKQFEIVGELNHGCDNEYDLDKPYLNGKYLYPRLLIRKI